MPRLVSVLEKNQLLPKVGSLMLNLRRRDGDADTIAPTLYTNRPSGKKASKAENTAAPTATAPATAVPTASTPVTMPSNGGGSKTDANPNATGPFMS